MQDYKSKPAQLVTSKNLWKNQAQEKLLQHNILHITL